MENTGSSRERIEKGKGGTKMIKGEGIWAFHGTMTYNPPRQEFREELSGDFIHKFYDGEGYWYNKGRSYSDEYCENIQEGMSIGELIEEINKKVEIMQAAIKTAENQEELEKIAEKIVAEFKEMGVK